MGILQIRSASSALFVINYNMIFQHIKHRTQRKKLVLMFFNKSVIKFYDM